MYNINKYLFIVFVLICTFLNIMIFDAIEIKMCNFEVWKQQAIYC